MTAGETAERWVEELVVLTDDALVEQLDGMVSTLVANLAVVMAAYWAMKMAAMWDHIVRMTWPRCWSTT